MMQNESDNRLDNLSDEGVVVAAFIEKRLQDNLKALEKHLPDVYEVFKDYQERRYFLLHDPYGHINVLDRDEEVLLFGENPVEEVLSRYESYKSAPICRPYIVLGAPDCKINPVHNGSLAGLYDIQADIIQKIALGNFVKDQIKGKQDIDIDLSRIGLPDKINTLFCFSTGLGFDLERFYLEKDIRHLFLIEPDLDIFYCSLQLVDWVSILEKSVSKGLNITLLISDDLDQLAGDVIQAIGRTGRHNAAGSFMYSGFYREEYSELFERFKKELDLSVFAGYGFYDDSRLSVAHSVLNVKKGIPLICSNRSINKEFGQGEMPVFIVGNGPSIDNDIQYIKENSGKAVVFSCGSALRTLYINGIEPDFHVELERTAHVPLWIKKSEDSVEFREYLKRIRLVALSQVHPAVFELFGNVGQIPKDTETGSLLIRRLLGKHGVPVISRLAPSCLHAAYSFAVVAGFRCFYLFGTDMGFKDPEYHHSKDSLYNSLEQKAKENFKGGQLQEYDANFGNETVFSNRMFPMFKKMLEAHISGWNDTFSGNIQTFNCSDGARIDGAEPLRSFDIDWSVHKSLDISKKELSDSLMSSFFSFVPDAEESERLEEYVVDSFAKVERMCAWLRDHLYEVDDVFEAADIVDNLAYKFHTNIDEMGLEEDESWLYSLFDGSLLYVLSAVQSTLFFPTDEEVRVEAFNKMVGVLDDLFETIASDFAAKAFVPDSEEHHMYLFESQDDG